MKMTSALLCFESSALWYSKYANAPAQTPLPALTLATNLTDSTEHEICTKLDYVRGQRSVVSDC